MGRDETIRIIRRHRQQLADLGVTSVSLFGSVARREERPGSDVDLLVTFASTPGLREYMAVKFALEEWLGAPADVIDQAAIADRWRPIIERDAILVA